jgi:hypothetical protein
LQWYLIFSLKRKIIMKIENNNNINCGCSVFKIQRIKGKSVTLSTKGYSMTADESGEKSNSKNSSSVKNKVRSALQRGDEIVGRCRPMDYTLRVIIIALLLPLFSFSPTYTGVLAGVVYDENRRPVSDAIIVLEEARRVTSTNRDGFFVFDPLPAGEYIASVMESGTCEQHFVVNIRNNRITTLDVEACGYYPSVH